jgi:hypothetical protein
MVGLINNKLGRIWKKVVMASFETLSHQLLGGTDKNHESL